MTGKVNSATIQIQLAFISDTGFKNKQIVSVTQRFSSEIDKTHSNFALLCLSYFLKCSQQVNIKGKDMQ